jgi:hypothetical protein
MINPPKLESIMLPTKEDLFNTGYTSCGGFSGSEVSYARRCPP